MKKLLLVPLLALAGTVDALVAIDGVSTAAGPPAYVPAADGGAKGRVVVVGMDGVDPRVLSEYVAAGALPRIARLVEANGLHELESELPPESPVAWSSMLTGVNPARHRIFDFIVRDAATTGYTPVNGMVDVAWARFLLDRFPVRPPRVSARLRYPTFLERVHRAGEPVLALRQPLLFPTPPLDGAFMTSGLGTPDLAGTNGSYAIYDAGFGLGREYTVFNGHRIHLDGGPVAGAYDTYLEGPFDRRRPEADGGLGRLSVPLRFERTQVEGGVDAVTVIVGGGRETIAKGRRSGFLPVEFTLPSWPPLRVAGRARFEVRDTEPLVVLVDPIQIDPMRPALPLSTPPEYAADLERRYGAYKTTGWTEQTFQLNDRSTTPEAFLSDLLGDMDHDAAVLLGELRRGAACTFTVFTETDRAAHCFWWLRDPEHPYYDAALAARLGDPLRTVYERMDRIVGDVADRLGPDDLLLLVSDHGFRTWRRGMNVNQWLFDEGFLVAKGASGEKTLPDFFRGSLSIDNVDWSRTKAYALGLGQVYVNVKGREPEGIVAPDEVDAVCADLRARLLAYVDRAGGGKRPIRDVIRLKDVYHGPYLHEAADLQLAFDEGYRVSWQTALLGGVEAGRPACEDNVFPWSGDHCSTDRRLVPGILVASKPFPRARAERPYGVKDIAATVLARFRLDVSDLDGAPIPVLSDPLPPRTSPAPPSR